MLDTSRSETSHSLAHVSARRQALPVYGLQCVRSRPTLDAIYVGSLDSNEKKFLTKATANAAYAAPGYLLFYRDKTLFAQHFDLSKFELTGEASPILTDIQYVPRIGHAVFSVVQ